MFGLSRWIRKQCAQRQLIKETEVLEAERRIQQRKRDNDRTQSLLLTLYELQRTMDPLIAAEVYNNRFCPLLSQLPEELLLCIIDFLCDDAVALQCLQIVSRTFLRLLDRESGIWRDVWYRTDSLYVRGRSFYLHDHLRLQFRRLLQRDGRCDNCRRWNDNYQYRLFDDCKFQQRYRHRPKNAGPAPYRKLYCYPCHTVHDVCQFSSTYQNSWRRQLEQRCLGQQGSVQLCEHIHVTWARIKAHIDDWRQQQRGVSDWKECLDNFTLECHDPSHDTRCTTSEAPTWPRARLGIGTCEPSIVVLNVEWKSHSRIDALALTADGRIPAPQLRTRFRELRNLGPADILCPPCRSGVLPEMAFFSPSAQMGRFVYYKTGEDDEIGSPKATFPPITSNYRLLRNSHYGRGRNGKRLDIKPHYPRGSGRTGISSQCLVASYKKDIMICRTTAITDPTVKIVPTNHWLHAMDTQTYPHPQASQIRPQCRDMTCDNYYQRQKEHYACSTWHIGDDPQIRL